MGKKHRRHRSYVLSQKNYRHRNSLPKIGYRQPSAVSQPMWLQTGRIRAFQDRTARYRPAPGGVSIGHFEITAGTLGCLVKRDGETFILSNNHVLANVNEASKGDAILQPGAHDGGSNPADQIATLEDFVPVSFTLPEPPSDCGFASAIISALNAGCGAIGSRTRYRIVRPQAESNLVDCAIARPLNPDEL